MGGHHTKVLERSELTSIQTLLIKNKVCWAGHFTRMGDKRIPKRMIDEAKKKRAQRKSRDTSPQLYHLTVFSLATPATERSGKEMV